MVGQQIFSLLLMMIAIVMVGLATIAWRNRPGPWASSFIVILLGLTFRVLGYAFLINSTDPETQLFWVVVQFAGVVAVVPAMLTFVCAYTGRETWLRFPKLGLLLAVPVATVSVGLFGPADTLFQDIMVNGGGVVPVVTLEPGIALVVFALWSYFVILVTVGLLGVEAYRSAGHRRQQTIILLCSPLIMGVASALSVFDLTAIDWLPVSTGITVMIMGFGALRLHLLGFVRLAQHALMYSIDDGVMVVDGRGYVADVNPAGLQLLHSSLQNLVGQPYKNLHRRFPELIPNRPDTTSREPIQHILNKQPNYFELEIATLQDSQHNDSGYVLIWHNITAYVEQERQLIQQRQLFENLLSVARTTSEGLTLRETLENILNIATELTLAEDSSLILLDSAGSPTYNLFAHGVTVHERPRGFVANIIKHGLASWVIQYQQSLLIHNTRTDKRWIIDDSSSIDERSVLCVPILHETHVLGVLTLTHSTMRHFTQDYLDLMEAAAAHMALALHNTQLFEEQRQEARRQNTLYQLLRAIGEHLDPQTVAQKAIETVTTFTGWATLTVLTPIKETEELAIMATSSLAMFTDVESLDKVEQISRQAIESGEAHFIEHAPPVGSQGLVEAGLAYEMVAIPLLRLEKVIGVLALADSSNKPFRPGDVQLAKSIADAIALALENAELYASTDKQLKEQTALRRAVTAIGLTLDLPVLLQTVAKEMCDALDATSAYIASYDGGTFTSTVLAEFMGDKSNDKERRSDLGETYYLPNIFPTDVAYLERNEPKMSHVDNPSLIESERAHMKKYGAKSTLVVPLHIGGRTVAYAEVWESRHTRVFTQDEIGLAQAIAQQVAVAMENARLYESVVGERGRLDAVIETSQDGIILVGMDGHILITNERAITYLQLPGVQADWRGKRLKDVFFSLRRHARAALLVVLREVRRAQQDVLVQGEGDCEILPRSIHWVNLPVVVDGGTIGWLVVLRDDTDARTLARMREDITRTMIHDLRNPLTVIHAAEGFLSEKWGMNLDAQANRFLSVIQQNVGKGLELVNAILDISRLENRQMPLEQTLFLVPDLIDRVVRGQLPLAEEKGVTIENVEGVDFVPPVWADVGLVERVLHNLLDNALKFSPAGGLIRFMTKVDYVGNREQVLVSVQDEGAGIPHEIRGQLFQQFMTGNQVARGTGLGLAFCKMALEAHGETIWVEASGREGTTMTFSLGVAPDLV